LHARQSCNQSAHIFNLPNTCSWTVWLAGKVAITILATIKTTATKIYEKRRDSLGEHPERSGSSI
jgi:hypothetical protein